jgi:hypothetical protein
MFFLSIIQILHYSLNNFQNLADAALLIARGNQIFQLTIFFDTFIAPYDWLGK